MPYPVEELIQLLDLESIEENIFRGRNRDIGTGRIFGGQVLAQALVAAQRTVDEDRTVHSMHGYFILAGDLEVPVVYFVDRLRDGRSYTTRRVTAIQHGKAIFNMSASFHRHEDGPSHQRAMPEMPPPFDLESDLAVIRREADQIPEDLRPVLTQARPIDFRHVAPLALFQPDPAEPEAALWVRALGNVGDDPLHHHAILAYASDYGLLGAAMRPHGRTFRDADVMAASLDHSIWFHAPFRADEWLLYCVDSPFSGGGRGFARGSFFTHDGRLVASVAQEGVVRIGKRRSG